MATGTFNGELRSKRCTHQPLLADIALEQVGFALRSSRHYLVHEGVGLVRMKC